MSPSEPDPVYRVAVAFLVAALGQLRELARASPSPGVERVVESLAALVESLPTP